MIDPKKEKSKFFRIFVYTKITANSLYKMYLFNIHDILKNHTFLICLKVTFVKYPFLYEHPKCPGKPRPYNHSRHDIWKFKVNFERD